MRKLKFLLLVVLVTVVAGSAHTQPAPLVSQLKLIIALGEADGFKSIKADLISTNSDGSKTLTFPLPLEGFKVTMIQNAQGRSVEATSVGYSESNMALSYFENESMRIYGGMPYYTQTDYKVVNPTGLEVYKSVTDYTKEGTITRIRLYEIANMKGYLLKIIPY